MNEEGRGYLKAHGDSASTDNWAYTPTFLPEEPQYKARCGI